MTEFHRQLMPVLFEEQEEHNAPEQNGRQATTVQMKIFSSSPEICIFKVIWR
jgi:hypothetical protein